MHGVYGFWPISNNAYRYGIVDGFNDPSSPDLAETPAKLNELYAFLDHLPGNLDTLLRTFHTNNLHVKAGCSLKLLKVVTRNDKANFAANAEHVADEFLRHRQVIM